MNEEWWLGYMEYMYQLNQQQTPPLCQHCGEVIPLSKIDEHFTLIRAQRLLAGVVDVSLSAWEVQLRELRAGIKANPEWIEHYG